MHFPDLTNLQFLPFENSSKLIAVGWLEPGHEYHTGDVEQEFAQKLAALLIEPWQPVIAVGPHFCGFCRFSGGPGLFRFGNSTTTTEVRMGASNLWLPADGFLYVAPSLILHYMDAHGYAPPTEFQAAVMACPPMRSMDYLKAILKHGPTGIVAR